ncbi:MROH1 protein, partial [Nyctibius bracteatus]|nr:MROH1 protein [Nyctibius bracteatus]
QAREMLVDLPVITEVLHSGDTDIKKKVLVVFRNIMGHLERKEASAIAVQLVEELLPLFDNESSQLRELSMGLFRDMVESVEGSDKEEMKKKVQRGLLPLFFHMSDESSSVAK